MLKAKKYGFGDFITIPFRISPVYFILELIKRLISALIPSAQIFITADIIDTANKIFTGQAEESLFTLQFYCTPQQFYIMTFRVHYGLL